MRMKLTRKADYAVRAMLEITRRHPNVCTTRQITAAMDLPRDFMSQILATLVRHALLDSSAGPAGGYTLARPPAEISLLEVIEIVEGQVAVDECVLGGGFCDWTQVCPLHEAWTEAKAGFVNHLSTTTFEHFADIDVKIRAGDYQPPGHTPPHPATTPRHGTNEWPDP